MIKVLTARLLSQIPGEDCVYRDVLEVDYRQGTILVQTGHGLRILPIAHCVLDVVEFLDEPERTTPPAEAPKTASRQPIEEKHRAKRRA